MKRRREAGGERTYTFVKIQRPSPGRWGNILSGVLFGLFLLALQFLLNIACSCLLLLLCFIQYQQRHCSGRREDLGRKGRPISGARSTLTTAPATLPGAVPAPASTAASTAPAAKPEGDGFSLEELKTMSIWAKQNPSEVVFRHLIYFNMRFRLDCLHSILSEKNVVECYC